MARSLLVCSLVGLLLCATEAQGRSQPQASGGAPVFAGFTAAQTIPNAIAFHAPALGSPEGAVAFFADDFNHDGHPDLLAINANGSVSLSVNDGAGHIAAPVQSSPTGPYVRYAVTADLNGDGFLDLVAYQPTGSYYNSPAHIVTLINQKDGTFATGSTLTLSKVAGPVDFSSDSNVLIAAGVTRPGLLPDIVFEYVYSPTLQTNEVERYTFLNDGTGQFSMTSVQTAQASAAYGYQFTSQKLLIADLNHDGKPDLLTESANLFQGTTSADLAFGNGDGSFSAPNSNTVAALPYFGRATLSLVHIRGNSTAPDIVIGASPTSYLALSNGDGTYQPPVAFLSDQILALRWSDLNGDGIPDLLYASGRSVVSYRGNPDGTLGAVLGAYSSGEADAPIEQGAAFVDLDGDGTVDFVTAGSESPNVTFGKGLGNGRFLATPLLHNASGTGSLQAPPDDLSVGASFDLNGDGKQDLIVGTGSGSLLSALNAGGGQFTWKLALPTSPTDIYVPQPLTADFNGDGRPDLVFQLYRRGQHTNSGFGVALSNGDGTFQSPVSLDFPFEHDNSAFSLTAGDVNGDGKTDLVISYGGDFSSQTTVGGYFVALGKGDGTFRAGPYVPYGSSPSSVSLVAFHGPHAPLDLMVSDTDLSNFSPSQGYGLTTLLTGNGDGTFGARQVLLSGGAADGVLAADLNGDGKLDLAFCVPSTAPNSQEIATYIYLGNDDGTFTMGPLVNGGIATRGVIGADVNGDGKLDLVSESFGSIGVTGAPLAYGLQVNLGNGDGTFSAAVSYPFISDGSLFAGDFLGDNTQSVVSELGAAFFQNLGGTSVSLTSAAGQTGAVTAQITPTLAGRPAPTGSATLSEGATALGTATVTNGTASISGLQLAAGQHTLTLSYSGDADFQPNTGTLTLTVAPPAAPDFTVTASASTLTITRGQTGTATLTVTPNSSVTSTVTFSCSGLPTDATCQFSPASVTAAGQPITTTLTISTAAASAAVFHAADRASGLRGLAVPSLALALLPLGLIHRRTWRSLALAAIAMVCLTFTGCGGSSNSSGAAPPSGGTPAGSYTVTVTVSAAGVTHTLPIAITVQ